DADGNYAFFSSQGSDIQPSQKPDVVARASGTFVVNENNIIVNNNGTSFSSPIIAGSLACLMQALPNLNIEQIKQYIRQSASQYTSPDYFLGYGIPDFGLALNNALSVQEMDAETMKIYPNPVQDELYLQLPTEFVFSDAMIFDITGTLILSKTISTSAETVNLSVLQSGMYILRLHSEDGAETFKFIKQ